ncbi:MAG TPA: hypothetical protein VIL20_28620 [Sandaracinaceae bacterium]|jgi:hypothetical protein
MDRPEVLPLHARSAALLLAVALLAASPASAITSNLVRTFEPAVTVSFDALPTGSLAADTPLAPGVVFGGGDPPQGTALAATVTQLSAGNRALEVAKWQTAGFVFDPPVAAVGVRAELVEAGDPISAIGVYAFDAAGVQIYSVGMAFPPGQSVIHPELTDAEDTPIKTLFIWANNGSISIDDLEYVPAPEPAARHGLPAAVAALLTAAWLERRVARSQHEARHRG